MAGSKAASAKPKWWNLIPATSAVPAAAANQQNDKYNDEKRGGIHVETPPGSAYALPPQPTLLILIRSYEPRVPADTTIHLFAVTSPHRLDIKRKKAARRVVQIGLKAKGK